MAYFTLAPNGAPGVSTVEDSVSKGIDKAGEVVVTINEAVDDAGNWSFDKLPEPAQDRISGAHNWATERIVDLAGGSNQIDIEEIRGLMDDINDQNGADHLDADAIRHQNGRP